ncbi:MAG: hypothetical protein A4E19_20105 [Nitrospira sp. SG-bin1]|nr:MAG: hypothetical protein A4E19_20105 [Nitrospira sp. SG-bin1]
MTSTDETRFFLPAWVISLALHGVIVGLAFALVAQIKPVMQEDMFQWDVALVEASKSEVVSDKVQSLASPEHSQARITSQSRTKPLAETSQIVKSVERKIEQISPTTETVRPIEQKPEPSQVDEESVEQRRAEVAEPKAEPVFDSKEPEPVAAAALPEPGEAQPAPRDGDAGPSVPTPEVPLAQDAFAQAPSPTNNADMSAVQVTKNAASDHRWLAESLWRRVAELKRYPNSARMNGQEGKVILKAVIRSDGQLAAVSVQKSSGYNVLDEAAIEAVKLACPLHMKQAIGKPQIVVSLPIVYSLAN